MKRSIGIIAFLFFSLPAGAHPLNIGALDVRQLNDRVHIVLQLNIVDVARISGVPLPPPANWLTQGEPRIFFATLGKANAEMDGNSCRWSNPSVKAEIGKEGEHVAISATAVCAVPRESFTLPLPFLDQASANYRLLVSADWQGRRKTQLITRDNPSLVLRTSSWHEFSAFVKLGAEHIGATPEQWFANGALRVPEGLDHILFVVALVLGGSSLLSLVKCVSGFTLGHSITLLLASLHLVSLPSRWVEAGIALSLALMALLTLIGKHNLPRWQLATVFGLLHGLGFASALEGLNLRGESLLIALLGFNLGIELAQILVVLCALLPLWLIARKSPASHSYAVRAIALAIALSGTYWAAERLFTVEQGYASATIGS